MSESIWLPDWLSDGPPVEIRWDYEGNSVESIQSYIDGELVVSFHNQDRPANWVMG